MIWNKIKNLHTLMRCRVSPSRPQRWQIGFDWVHVLQWFTSFMFCFRWCVLRCVGGFFLLCLLFCVLFAWYFFILVFFFTMITRRLPNRDGKICVGVSDSYTILNDFRVSILVLFFSVGGANHCRMDKKNKRRPHSKTFQNLHLRCDDIKVALFFIKKW